MPDFATERVTPGQKFAVKAEVWNAILDAVRRVLDGSGDPLGAGLVAAAAVHPVVTVLLRNDTDSTRGVRSVYRLGGPLTDVAAAPESFQRRPVFAGLIPDGSCGVTAIGLEPARAGAVIRAAVTGVVVAEVDVTDPSHEWAAPADGESGHLVSSEYPSDALILWQSGGGSGGSGSGSGGTGVVTCVVLLDPEPCGGSGSGDVIEYVTNVCLEYGDVSIPAEVTAAEGGGLEVTDGVVGIAVGGVVTAMIADGAVTGTQIADGAVLEPGDTFRGRHWS